MAPAMTAFRRLGNRLPLVPAQRLDRKPGPPQVDLGHGDRRPGQRPGDAVVDPEHLGGAGRGQLQGLALGATAPRAAQISWYCERSSRTEADSVFLSRHPASSTRVACSWPWASR